MNEYKNDEISILRVYLGLQNRKLSNCCSNQNSKPICSNHSCFASFYFKSSMLEFCRCQSDIGKKSRGKQLVGLGNRCLEKGIVMHELLHTLGFFHEQSRADRDNYVNIHRDNIKAGEMQNTTHITH